MKTFVQKRILMRTAIATSVLLTLSVTASSAEHTSNQQYLLEIINHARLDPTSYAALLGVDLNEGLTPNTISSLPKQPLAGNTLLQDAAQSHNNWMFSSNQLSHNGENGSTAGSRATSAGYLWSVVGENIQAAYNPNFTTLAVHGKNAVDKLFIDAGIAGREHRRNLLNNNFREIGISDGLDAWSGFGTLQNPTYLLTQLFASKQDNNSFITGVVFEDYNDNQAYDPGEGIEGETVSLDNGTSVLTNIHGAYSIEVPRYQTYRIFFNNNSGYIRVGSENVKVDLIKEANIGILSVAVLTFLKVVLILFNF